MDLMYLQIFLLGFLGLFLRGQSGQGGILCLVVVFVLEAIFFKGKNQLPKEESRREQRAPSSPELRREPARLLIHDTRFAHVKKKPTKKKNFGGQITQPSVAFFFFFLKSL